MTRQSAAWAVCCALLLSGCNGIQSALSPAGHEASRIALLTWVLFAGAAAVLLIVCAALVLAVRGSKRCRRFLGSDRAIRLGGIAFPAVTLTVLLSYGVWLMRDTIATDRPAALRIDVTGEQWWWRIAYAQPDTPGLRHNKGCDPELHRRIGTDAGCERNSCECRRAGADLDAADPLDDAG